MMINMELDIEAAKGAVRTSGALMLGNVFVSYFILGVRNSASLGMLFTCGVITIFFSSLKRRKS